MKNRNAKLQEDKGITAKDSEGKRYTWSPAMIACAGGRKQLLELIQKEGLILVEFEKE